MTQPSTSTAHEQPSYDWPTLIEELNRRLHLRATPIGMKWFTSVEEMEAIPRIRRPKDIHTADQLVAQAARLNWTVGLTAKDLAQPVLAVFGSRPPGRGWRCGKTMAGRVVETEQDSAAHKGMDSCPYGRYQALASRRWCRVGSTRRISV